MSVRSGNEIQRLEAKMEERFASLRDERRADFRFLIAVITGILMTMMLVVVVIALQSS